MADKKTLTVIIAAVDSPRFDGTAEALIVPGVEGEMTILPQHTALITPLRTGVVTVKTGDEDLYFEIKDRGTLEVSNNVATVLIT